MKRKEMTFPEKKRIDFTGIHKRMKQTFVQAAWFGLLIAGSIYIWGIFFEALSAKANLLDISLFFKG
ncbi:hypothetical protein [Hydrogenimonas sp.]